MDHDLRKKRVNQGFYMHFEDYSNNYKTKESNQKLNWILLFIHFDDVRVRDKEMKYPVQQQKVK